MKNSLAQKINGLVLLTALVIGVSSLLSTYFIIRNDHDKIVKEDIAGIADASQYQIELLKHKVQSAAVLAASNQTIASAVEKGDASVLRGYGKKLMGQAGIGATTFVNSKGIVIARTHSDRAGDSVLNQSVVKSALSAVVADEVRALAERTTKATKEIGEMIKSIQSETKNAVLAMEEGVSEVEKGAEASQRSGEALQEIQREIEQVNMQINQIATAAEEQTATTNDITTNIQQVTEVVHQTARGAEETSSAATLLSEEAQHLHGLIKRFKL